MADSSAALITEKLAQLADEFDQKLVDTKDESELRHVKAQYLGKTGELSVILKNLKSVTPEERPVIGQQANQLKQRLLESFNKLLAQRTAAQQAAKLARDSIDPSLPGLAVQRGALHPLTQVNAEIEAIFMGMGFSIKTGPEVETEFYNFEALNIPADHPARDMQDTFYLGESPSHLLRTHTSPVQIHVMKAVEPPVQIIAPGPVYRRDSDVTHTPIFHQVEGLLVDRQISFAHLKGVIEAFLHSFFGPKTSVRFRPSYFPFTEPSAEVDIACLMCPGGKAGQKNCRVCQGTGWLEVMGCGMVHPAVFRAVDYDPKQWSGFAFGMGVERLTMLKYRISDIRLLYENDKRFLEQFS